MSRLPIQFPCEANVPQVVRQRVDLLHAKQQQVLDLEARIQILRNECDHLRVELSRYLIQRNVENDPGLVNSDGDKDRPQVPFYARKGAPIHQCPDEILGFIFSLYLIPRHMCIRRLLLVCKRFYRLVLESPRLWARIQIWDIDQFIRYTEKQPSTLYISACMERSRGLPIDVELDISNVHEKPRRYLGASLNYIDHPLSKYAFDGMVYEYQQYCSEADIYTRYVGEAIERLKCPDRCPDECLNQSHQNCYIKRWRSLSIDIADRRSLAKCIWDALEPVTHNFVTIRISGCTRNWLDHDEAGSEDGTLDGLEDMEAQQPPDFSSAKSLQLPLGRSLLDFKASQAVLQHLDIQFYDDLVILHELSMFKHLEILKLCGFSERHTLLNSFTIRLPSLKYLELSGGYEVIKDLDLDFPALRVLVFSGNDSHHVVSGISPNHLKWKIHYIRGSSMAHLPLISLLLEYPEVQTFTIPADFKEEVTKTIIQCQRWEELPNHLQWLAEDENGRVERFDISRARIGSSSADAGFES